MVCPSRCLAWLPCMTRFMLTQLQALLWTMHAPLGSLRAVALVSFVRSPCHFGRYVNFQGEGQTPCGCNSGAAMQVPLGVQGQGAASLSPSAEHGPALSPPTVRLSPAASTQPLLWLPPWRRPRQDSGNVGQDGDGGDDGGDDDGDGESRTTLTSADTLLHHTTAA